MNEKKAYRQHKILDAHPVIGSILFALVFTLITYLITIILATIISIALIQGTDGISSHFTALSVVTVPITCFLFWLWFYHETDGLVKGGNIRNGIRIITVFLIYCLAAFIIMLSSGASLSVPSSQAVFTSLFAGLTEELSARGLLIAPMMRKKPDKKIMLTGLFLSASIFAVAHLSNLLIGASVSRTISQFFSSIFIGVIFASIFLLTGNLLPCMILHTLYDIFVYSISDPDTLSSTGVMSGSADIYSLITDILLGIAAGYSIYYILREPVQEKIFSVWHDKWHRNEAN